ncbi:MAG: DUF559 domain-containing protein [Clostridia bacterium]|nr:DUF559 domain-containing protein [Clostridia bacterium]
MISSSVTFGDTFSAGEGLDEIRDYELRRLGITVLRYSDHDINRNFKVVCEDILNHLK